MESSKTGLDLFQKLMLQQQSVAKLSLLKCIDQHSYYRVEEVHTSFIDEEGNTVYPWCIHCQEDIEYQESLTTGKNLLVYWRCAKSRNQKRQKCHTLCNECFMNQEDEAFKKLSMPGLTALKTVKKVSTYSNFEDF